ncbi:hypothetical protein H0W32_00155 [Patescibacteria group bacterium]|nr:hypothetical protein [Patescibacteria group bacterium]
MVVSKKRILPVVSVIFLLLLAGGIYGYTHYSKKQAENTVPILVIAPTVDAAIQSLGGYLLQSKNPVHIAVFFGQNQQISTSSLEIQNKEITIHNFSYADLGTESEAERAELQGEITLDIQSLVASFGDTEALVYGPAYFTEDTTSQDIAFLHVGFLNMAQGYPKDSVRFFMYENYPEAEQYMKTSVASLQKNLEDRIGTVLTKIQIPLKEKDVEEKTEGSGGAIKEFTETRCGTEPRQACEVVYELEF